MSGDWIKMRTDLGTAPKVVRIVSALQADTLRVVGALHAIWSIFDSHTSDGKLNFYTIEILDSKIGWTGFAQAMLDVGWLKRTAKGVEIPRFSDHNGTSAKRRAQDTDRKRTVREMSASDADKNRTREEKNLKTTHARGTPVDNSINGATHPTSQPRAKERGKSKPVALEARPGESMEEYRNRLAQHWKRQ